MALTTSPQIVKVCAVTYVTQNTTTDFWGFVCFGIVLVVVNEACIVLPLPLVLKSLSFPLRQPSFLVWPIEVAVGGPGLNTAARQMDQNKYFLSHFVTSPSEWQINPKRDSDVVTAGNSYLLNVHVPEMH